MMIPSLWKFPAVDSLKAVLIVVFGLLISSPAGLAPAQTVPPAPIIEITFKDGLITAELVDAPLIEVLQRIRKEFGFKIHFHGELSESITLSFTDLPLEKCLRQLTANHSISVVSKTQSGVSEQNGARQIAEVWVLSRGKTAKIARAIPAAPVVPSPGLAGDKVMGGQEYPDEPEIGVEKNLLLDEILNNPDADKSKQRQTVQDLVEIGDSEAVMTMASYLGNEDKELRQMLVSGLGSVENEQSTLVLGQVLQAEADPEIRKTAVRALAERQDDNTARALLEEALNDADEGVKTLAVQLLKE
jgi:hypothetical protein